LGGFTLKLRHYADVFLLSVGCQSGSDNFTCPMCRAPLFLKPGEAETPLSPQWGETVEASPITSLSRDNTEQSAVRMVMHPPGRLIRAFLGMSATAERVEDVALAVPDLQLDASHFLMFEFEELRARHHGTGWKFVWYCVWLSVWFFPEDGL
jgi:hypothetical protein